MFCKIICNSLIVICIMVTTVYTEFAPLKKDVADIREKLKLLSEKTGLTEKRTSELDRMQSETKSSLESFKTETGDKLLKLIDDKEELDKSAFLAETQVMKMASDMAMLQGESQVPPHELQECSNKLEKIENKTSEISKQLVEKENQIMKLASDKEQMENEFNLAVEKVKKEMNASIDRFMNDTITELKYLRAELAKLNKSFAEIEKQIKKLTADLDEMKRGKELNLPVYVNVSKQFPTNETSCTFSTQAGSSYIRWGSSSCPSDAELIYNGFVGGSMWNYTGSAVDYLCLPTYPDKSQLNVYEAGAHIHGGEYRISNAPQTLMDPVCAVCRIPRSTSVMIPAKNSCSPGWTREYRGYLMAGKWSHKAATEFICVDESLSSIPGSGGEEQGKLLYYSYMLCGHTSCVNYNNNRIVCTVCSK